MVSQKPKRLHTRSTRDDAPGMMAATSASMEAFTALGLSETLAEAAVALGWAAPSKIQQEAVPHAVSGTYAYLRVWKTTFYPVHASLRRVCGRVNTLPPDGPSARNRTRVDEGVCSQNEAFESIQANARFARHAFQQA